MSGPETLSVRVGLALDGFDLEVDFATAQRATGIFGPSGAGKTSLLRAIAGLERLASGRIVCDGEVWLDSQAGIFVPPERRGIGYVPQDGLLFPHLDVRGNLLAGARRARRLGRDPEAALRSVCGFLELGPLLGRRVEALSGGERQRVALGRAICSGPRLLVLDEPLASLDQPLRRRVLPYLRRVRLELGLPILLVSHDAGEVQALCDEIVVLRAGKVAKRGPVREVLADPGVFPMTQEEGFVNVVSGWLEPSDGVGSEVRLSDERPELRLLTPKLGGSAGAEVLVGIPAREILLALREPVGISAQNVLPATVEAVEAAGELHVVRLRLAGDVPLLVALVTGEARAQLKLAPGLGVYLILKAAGCLPYGGHEA